MATTEKDEVLRIVSCTATDLRETSHPSVKRAVEIFAHDVFSNKILIAASPLEDEDIPLMNVLMFPIEVEGETRAHPIIAVRTPGIFTASSDDIQSHMVRSLAIYEQFPLNGFQRRLREVYSQAIAIQRDWLNRAEKSKVSFDPRIMDKEALLRKVLGEQSYLTDVGFNDWALQVMFHMDAPENSCAFWNLQYLRDNEMFFLMARARESMNPEPAFITDSQIRSYLESSTPDERAQAVAIELVAKALPVRLKHPHWCN